MKTVTNMILTLQINININEIFMTKKTTKIMASFSYDIDYQIAFFHEIHVCYLKLKIIMQIGPAIYSFPTVYDDLLYMHKIHHVNNTHRRNLFRLDFWTVKKWWWKRCWKKWDLRLKDERISGKFWFLESNQTKMNNWKLQTRFY